MFFVLVSALFFVASLFAAGGAFLYQRYLLTSIASKSDTLQKAENAFDPSTIQDLVRLDSRMNNAETLLQKHVTTLEIFDFLSQQTLQNVQFTSFAYTLGQGGGAQINMSGVADGFATVALQSDQFGAASKLLKNVVFSGIAVDSNGHVAFDVKADIDPSILSYAKNLDSVSAPIPPSGTDAAAGASTTPLH